MKLIISAKDTMKDEQYRSRKDIDELVIPDDIEGLRNGAFRDCSNLRRVYFGNGVKSGGSYVFYNCKNIEAVYVDDAYALFNYRHDNYGSPLQYGANLYIDNKLCETLIIPDDISSPYSLGTFIGCGSIKKISISRNNVNFEKMVEAIRKYNDNPNCMSYFVDGVAKAVELIIT